MTPMIFLICDDEAFLEVSLFNAALEMMCKRQKEGGRKKETGDGKENSGRIDREQGCIYKYMKNMKNKKRTDEGNKIKSRRDTLKKLSITFI